MVDERSPAPAPENVEAARIIAQRLRWRPRGEWRKRRAQKGGAFAALALSALLASILAPDGVLGPLGYFAAFYFGLLSVTELSTIRQPSYRERGTATRMSATSRRHILYLRSFIGYGTYHGVLEEKAINGALSEVGPVVALAEPDLDLDQPAPMDDVIRVLSADAAWQEKVIALMRGAQLVVVRIAQSPGVLWELEQAQRIVPPERLVLFVPSDGNYLAVKKACDPLLKAALPLVRAPESHFIAFDATWTPYFVTAWVSRMTRSMLFGGQAVMRSELAPVFSRLQLRTSMPLSNRRRVLAVIYTVWGLVVGTGLVASLWALWYFGVAGNDRWPP